MSITIHRLPTFNSRASRSEKIQVTKLGPQIQQKAQELGAAYAYICKNKTGNYYPVSVQFIAKGDKSISRRTLLTLAN